jgi:hypothetical protein
MACTLKPGTHVFEPRAGEHRWWQGDVATFPLWPAGQEHPHIVIEHGLLDPAQCRLLIDCFERNREACSGRTGSVYWDGRYIWASKLPRAELNALRIMQQVRHYSTLRIMQRFSPGKVVYSDTAQLVCWPPGVELDPHADNINPDGSPNATAHRDYSSIVYLNDDDYAGGETFFPGHGIRIKPRPGTLVLFGAGSDYVHGVTKVMSGLRYTYAGWFTFDPKWEDREAKLIY